MEQTIELQPGLTVTVSTVMTAQQLRASLSVVVVLLNRQVQCSPISRILCSELFATVTARGAYWLFHVEFTFSAHFL